MGFEAKSASQIEAVSTSNSQNPLRGRDKLAILGDGIITAIIVYAFEQFATTSTTKTIFERAVEVLFGPGSDHTLIIPPKGPGSKSLPNRLKRIAEDFSREDGKVANLGRKSRKLFRTR